MNQPIPLHSENKIQASLDKNITEAIRKSAKDHNITPADVAGVFRAIELRLFIK